MGFGNQLSLSCQPGSPWPRRAGVWADAITICPECRAVLPRPCLGLSVSCHPRLLTAMGLCSCITFLVKSLQWYPAQTPPPSTEDASAKFSGFQIHPLHPTRPWGSSHPGRWLCPSIPASSTSASTLTSWRPFSCISSHWNPAHPWRSCQNSPPLPHGPLRPDPCHWN